VLERLHPVALRGAVPGPWSWRPDSRPEPGQSRISCSEVWGHMLADLPPARRAGRAERSRTSSSIARAATSASWCSHTLTTSHPAAVICSSVSRSRRAMPRNFRRHQLVLVLGRWLCSGQECQKQPSTNTAISAPRNRTSARRRRLQPGTGRSTTNRRPRRCNALRNASSGRVPDLLVRRITREVAGDEAGGTGPGSRCWYTAPASRTALTVGDQRVVPLLCPTASRCGCSVLELCPMCRPTRSGVPTPSRTPSPS
jgi:hypothetical protein